MQQQRCCRGFKIARWDGKRERKTPTTEAAVRSLRGSSCDSSLQCETTRLCETNRNRAPCGRRLGLYIKTLVSHRGHHQGAVEMFVLHFQEAEAEIFLSVFVYRRHHSPMPRQLAQVFFPRASCCCCWSTTTAGLWCPGSGVKVKGQAGLRVGML